MSIKKNFSGSNILKCSYALWMAVIFIFCIVVSFITRQPVIYGLRFAFFVLSAVLLPGFTVLKISGLKAASDIECFGYSFLFGYCADLVMYLCIVPFQFQSYAILILLFFDVACIAYLYLLHRQKKLFDYETDQFGEKVCFVFVILFLLADLVLYTLKNALPPLIDSNLLSNDTLYWVGNTIELTKEFPIKNFRNYPQPYNYHYFSSMQLALAEIITGIPSVITAFVYQMLQPVFLIVFGAYMLFGRFTKKKNLVCIGIFSLLFTSGFECWTVVTYRSHMFEMPFGFDYGMGIFLFCLLFLFQMYYDNTFSIKQCMLVWILFAVLVGTKASTASIAILALGIVCVAWLVKKQWRKSFLLGLPMLVIFIAMYIFVVNIRGYSGGNILGTLHAPTKIYESKEVLGVLYDWFSRFSIVGQMGFLIIYAMLCSPVVYGGVAYVICNKILRKEKLEQGSVIILITMLAAEMLSVYIGMYGHSQMYFIMCAYPLGILFIVMNSDHVFQMKWEWLLMAGMLICGVFLWLISYADIRNYKTQLIASNYFGISWNTDSVTDIRYVSASQWEAYTYLRDIADKNALILSNQGTNMLGAVSECYVHGCGDLMMLNNAEEQENYIEEKMKNFHYSYIVYERMNAPDFVMLADNCEEIFENDSTVIYAIK